MAHGAMITTTTTTTTTTTITITTTTTTITITTTTLTKCQQQPPHNPSQSTTLPPELVNAASNDYTGTIKR